MIFPSAAGTDTSTLRSFAGSVGWMLILAGLFFHDRWTGLIILATWSAILRVGIAVGTRQPLFKEHLNYWDEALAFFAIRCLAEIVGPPA